MANEGDWPQQHAWFADALTRLDTALRKRIAALDLESQEPA